VYLATVSLTAGILTIATDKSTYQHGESVRFTIRNNAFTTLSFPDPGLGLMIMKLDSGEIIHTGRLSPAVIHYIHPLQSETSTWDQTEFVANENGRFEYRFVAPGDYVASVKTAGGFEPSARAEVTFRLS